MRPVTYIMNRSLLFVVAAVAVAIVVAGRQFPAAVAAPGDSKRLIDNDRVTASEVTLQPGAPGGRLGDPARDVVVVSIGANGPASGAVTFEPKGAASMKATAPGAARAIIVELKDHQVAPLKNTSGYPDAFPRPGVKKVLENSRVMIWDYTWTAGVPTPMHFHDKDVVVVYMEDGALRSTEPNGQSVINEHYFGFTKFNPRERVHTEELVKGKARAVIVELK